MFIITKLVIIIYKFMIMLMNLINVSVADDTLNIRAILKKEKSQVCSLKDDVSASSAAANCVCVCVGGGWLFFGAVSGVMRVLRHFPVVGGWGVAEVEGRLGL